MNIQLALIRRLAIAGLACLPLNAMAQDNWPSKSITIIIPAAPGGTTDIVGRMISEPLAKELGQTVVIENKAGAAGIIGSQSLIRSKPDGYTLIMGNIGPNAINYSLYKDLPYKKEDFIPITNVISVPNVLVVNEATPVNNVQELLTYVASDPKNQTFGSSGKGQSPHMSGELFMQRGNIKAEHISYKGAGPAVAALLANQFTFMIDNLPSSLTHIKSGKLKALAVTSDKRVADLPDVPTMKEAGVDNMVVTAWFGLFAPAGTPDDVVNKIHAAAKKVLESDNIKERFAQLGGEAGGNSPAEYAEYVKSQQEMWADIVKTANINMD
ncbi:MAG: tripartite tricarboxylate transporter substrate binding protein [Pelistega sp.]|nr:tripartite tricarboxylate transporter substrate binding protein [Pelistega sp.]